MVEHIGPLGLSVLILVRSVQGGWADILRLFFQYGPRIW